MSPPNLVHKVEELTDLELALLLSFVANEHCLIRTEEDALESLQHEIQLAPDSHLNVENVAFGSRENTGEPSIPNVVMLRNLELANDDVQIQALELMRTKRLLTRTSVVTAPKAFSYDSLNGLDSSTNLRKIDHIFLSHTHDIEDGFANLEKGSEWFDDDRSSSSSVVRKSVPQKSQDGPGVTFSEEDIQVLVQESKNTKVTSEVECYLQNIVTFLRMHRAVDGGINPWATKFFKKLTTCLAPFSGLNYVTPSLVAIAARKVFPHRIILTAPERDRSLQYGSDLTAVKAVLEGVTPEAIIEDVLTAVEVPS
ncbi:MAG: hypothetical protein Q9169_002599 [Polycauliona sp. 2 TL-2023]